MILAKYLHQLQNHCCAPWLVLFFVLMGGCGLAPEISGLKGGSTDATFDPSPGSAAFQRLRLEKTESVVILNIQGDDVHGSMKKIYRAMLDKGYSVRDVDDTLRTLGRASLLGQKSTAPAYLKKAASIFSEQVAVAGKVEVVQASPTRVLVELYLIDLKKQKILWKAKASHVGRYFSVNNPFEKAVVESVTKVFSVLPQGNP